MAFEENLTDSFEDLAVYLDQNLPHDPQVTDYRDEYLDCEEVRKIFHLGSQFFYIIDISKFKYIYINDNIRNILGYDPAEYTIEYSYDIIHPADRAIVIRARKKSMEIDYGKINKIDPRKVNTSINYRIKKKNSNYIHVLHQNVPYKLDKNNNILYVLGMITDINHLKKDNSVELKILFPDGKEFTFSASELMERKEIFSKREVEIIGLISEGHRSRDIAKSLNISYNTVLTHRKNILKKAELRNTAELLSFSREHSIL